MTELHTRDILFDLGTGVVASSAPASSPASSSSSLNIIGAAGLKHPRDPSGELGEPSPKIARNASSSVGQPSELLHTPLQSPTPSEPASPARSFILSEDKDEKSHPTNVPIQHHGNDPNAFFTGPTEHQRRECLLQALHDGKQLNIDRPDYTFNLPLDGRDWGPRMTRIYNVARQKEVLTSQDLNEVAVLSGVLHVNEEFAQFSKDEILQIRQSLLQMFYTDTQQKEDLKRARAARGHWAIWYELWSSIEMSASLATDQGKESALDTTPIIDSIMAAYEDCKAKNILPILFMALHVFRKFDTWSKLRNEAECAMAMVGPILEEVLHIQHEVKFTSANFTSAHGQERKQELGQHGSSRQPDIVGCVPNGKEIYFGELKGIHATKHDMNVDTLRLAIFAKDALDHLHCCLVENPPLLTFQTKGKTVVFFLAAKQGNAIVHVRISSFQLPSNLSELNLNQEFFFRLFQVQTLLETTREYLKNRRVERLQDYCPFPTLGTPERLHAMRTPSKVGKSL
ncbi:hypothetical protein BGX34_002964 [Mortierella sp. NVP85]|nr:hypothetical protein BGX34_002964 [Mortierella sp. NVP85]